MALRAVAVIVLALSACTQAPATPVAHVSSSSSPVASPSQSPDGKPGVGPASPPPPLNDLPVKGVDFSCRLPIYTNGTTITDSFISLPSGTVTVDPSGNQGQYFDRAYSKWVPVGREAVSPDGAHYATVEIVPNEAVYNIHIVDVATGNDHSIRADAGNFGATPIVFDYATEGIYMVVAFEHIWPGVWLFDPVTGSLRQVADVERPEVIASAGVLWYGQVNAGDPKPFTTASSAGILPDEVGRFDLRSGSRESWLYRPGLALEVIGVDTSGRPLIQMLFPGSDPNIASTGFFDTTKSQLLLGLDSSSQREIYKGPLVDTLEKPIADAHGVWFGSEHGIYLYSAANGLQKVSNQPGFPANGCF